MHTMHVKDKTDKKHILAKYSEERRIHASSYLQTWITVRKQCQAAITAINIDGQMQLDVIHSQTKQLGKEALLLGALCNVASVES